MLRTIKQFVYFEISHYKCEALRMNLKKTKTKKNIKKIKNLSEQLF